MRTNVTERSVSGERGLLNGRRVSYLVLLAQDAVQMTRWCRSPVEGGERHRRGRFQPRLTRVSNVAGLTVRCTRRPAPTLA